jgi:carbon monoxide dehydrogenase subunit G
MELTNEFRVGVPVDEAWTVLTDVERIAPCLPGAQLTEVHGDRYTGNVKVKVGPITAQYKGTATFVEKDEVGRRVVLKADGRDTRGQGNASALVTATLVAEGDGTLVTVQTDLTVTGKVAQFGRGVLADVSAKLIGQFVQSLEADVLSGSAAVPAAATAPDPVAAVPGGAPTASANGTTGAPPVDADPAGPVGEPVAAGTGPTAAPVVVGAATGPRTIDSPEVAPVDLLGTAGAPVVKRIGPVVGVLVVVLWLLRRRRLPSDRVLARRSRRLAAAAAAGPVVRRGVHRRRRT